MGGRKKKKDQKGYQFGPASTKKRDEMEATSSQDIKEDNQSSKTKKKQPTPGATSSPAVTRSRKKAKDEPALSETESDGEYTDGYDTDVSRVSSKSFAEALKSNSSSSNRSSIENSPPSPVTPTDVKKKCPPITMRDHVEFKKLSGMFPPSSFIATCRHGEYKITAHSEEVYSGILDHFKSSNIEHFTNAPRKPIKVVIKGLHNDTTREEVQEFLQAELQTSDITVTQMRKTTPSGKVPLPLFLVVLPDVPSKKRLVELKFMLQTRIKTEDYIQKSPVVQCHNCQYFDHHSSRCGYKARCVKCLQSHRTIDCQKKKSDPPRCCNCLGEHPANYRRCPVYMKLLQLRTNAQASKASDNSKQPLLRTIQRPVNIPALMALKLTPPTKISLRPELTIKNPKAPVTKSSEKLEDNKLSPEKPERKNSKKAQKQQSPTLETDSVSPPSPPPPNENSQSCTCSQSQSESRPLQTSPKVDSQSQTDAVKSASDDSLSEITQTLKDINTYFNAQDALAYVGRLSPLLKSDTPDLVLHTIQIIVKFAMAAQGMQTRTRLPV
jgi:hypothetical protein